MTRPIALAISAHDPLGGAGLAADITTFAARGVHGVLAVTAVSAQHLDSVDAVIPVDPLIVSSQITGILDEMRPDAVKTGMLGSATVVSDIAQRVSRGELVAPVVDPVLVDGRGIRFVSPEIEDAYRADLFPVARVITPNLAEAALLAGIDLRTVEDVVAAAPLLARLGSELVVVTGGGFHGDQAIDVVIAADGSTRLLTAERCGTNNVRGSGCTFASAVACGLALKLGAYEAVEEAKRFVTDRIADSDDRRFPDAKAGPISHV